MTPSLSICRQHDSTPADRLRAGVPTDMNEAQYFWWTLDERDLSGQEISVDMF